MSLLNPKYLWRMPMKERISTLYNWYAISPFQYKECFSYFSMWALIVFGLQFYFQFFLLKKIAFNMLLQMVIGGTYITHIFPQKIKIHYLNIEIDEYILFLVDVLFHHFPFVYFLCKENPCLNYIFDWKDFFIINIPILFYFYTHDLTYYYGLYFSDLCLLFLQYITIFYFFVLFSSVFR